MTESSKLEGKEGDTPPARCACCSLALFRLMLEDEVKADRALLSKDLKDHLCAVEVASWLLAELCDPFSDCNGFQSNGS
jgi:hypothetical protein